MKHMVMFFGGIGSWATAKRVAEQHGTEVNWDARIWLAIGLLAGSVEVALFGYMLFVWLVLT